MPDDINKPVRIDHKKALAKAKLRPGFTAAWDVLETLTIFKVQAQAS
mgnify:CR=1 FL=1